MSDLGFNKIAAAGLVTGLMVIGLNELSHGVFHTEKPEEPGYLIEVTTTDSADGPVEEKGPVDYGLLLAAADIEAGKRVANKCVNCHVFDQSEGALQGPPLWDIVGRQKATYEGFKYSAALTSLESDWSYQALDEYLTRPSAYAPGTAMNFIGLKKERDRMNIIAYMHSLSDNPLPFPDPLPPEAPAEDTAVLDEAVEEISDTLDAPLEDAVGVEEAAAEIVEIADDAADAAGDEVVESVEGAGEAIIEAE
ncbi:MAG: cytochrome c family protein [Pseudomonadota bacterium]